MATGLGTSPPFSLPFLFLFLDLPIYLCPFPSFHVSVCPCKNFAAPTYFTLLRPVTTTLPTNRIANVIVRNCNPLMSRYYAFRVTVRCVATCVFHLYSHFRSVMFIFVFICRFAKDETIISSHIWMNRLLGFSNASLSCFSIILILFSSKFLFAMIDWLIEKSKIIYK